MKKIVPFNNVLNFSTDVCEITAISLEHEIKKSEDEISGVFYISGEYKMTDGQLEREKFNFELPFDIALGTEYKLDSLVVDIDDFRYELVDSNKLKVNIDLYVLGEEIERVLIDDEVDDLSHNEEEVEVIQEEEEYTKENTDEDKEEVSREVCQEEENREEVSQVSCEEENREEDNLLHEMLGDDKEKEEMKENSVNIVDNNENINIFNGFNEEEKYVTYRVYRVVEGDSLDKIMEKYEVSKEELEKYNDISSIKPGDKLIIPANDK